MKFTLKQLAVFDAIATHGSVSQAARSLSVTQSAASMALSQLENSLGRPLFDRKGKSLHLNQWGRWLRPHVRTMFTTANQIEMGFAGQHLLSGEIRIGASQTVADHLLPKLLSRLDSDFPQVAVHLTVANNAQLEKELLNYSLDLCLIEGFSQEPAFEQQSWQEDELVIIAAPTHPYSQVERVSLAQLEQARWVMRERGSGIRQLFERASQDKLKPLTVQREYSEVSILIELVMHNNYLSCVPRRSVAEQLEQRQVCQLNVPELKLNRYFSFIWRKDESHNPLRQCVIQATRQVKL